MTASGSRSAHANAILGPKLAARLPTLRILLVGAGGIGCELLKNLVLTGFGDITLLDLDTIDLSNLNRQFLFRKKDVKNSKALVAAATAGAFNPSVKITPIHANIKESQFDVPWFQSFAIVLNALDNLDARRHVNRMCMAGNVPLVESGTAGYLGQVQPLLKDTTECFDCVPKPTPKSFPVCTIRSTPSQPIHCIVWAKSYLFSQLFGEDEDASASQAELDAALQAGENAEEISKLRQEQQAFAAVRSALRSTSDAETAAQRVFEKVFDADVRNLLSMADMWRTRAPPVPLPFGAIRAGTFEIPDRLAKHLGALAVGYSATAKSGKGSNQTEAALSNTNGKSKVDAAKLRDQRVLGLEETMDLFVSSTNRLAARLREGELTIAFDKDDLDALDFVTASANLRSFAYGIQLKSKWEVKEMAGNIIPAIATTNAIIAGLIVLQALHLLRRQSSVAGFGLLRNVYAQVKPVQPLLAIYPSAPDPKCGVCRDTFAVLRCDPTRASLGDVVRAALGDGNSSGAGGTGDREVAVFEGTRLLAEPDWDDNLDRPLADLGIERGKFLTIVDEEGDWGTLALAIAGLPEGHPADGSTFVLPHPMPAPRKIDRPPTPAPAPDPVSVVGTKRAAADEDDEIEALDGPPAPKRARTAQPNGGADTDTTMKSVPDVALESLRKKQVLEEEGIVLLDGPGETLQDHDVVIID